MPPALGPSKLGPAMCAGAALLMLLTAGRVSAQFAVLEHSWGDPIETDRNVMMTPVVIQLDDDNENGIIDDQDLPEIVFLAFTGTDYNNNSGTSSTLWAISIVEGQVVVKFSTQITGGSADAPGRQIAAGNIDGQPGNEIVTCTRDARIRAYDSDGLELWLSDPIGSYCRMPSIADIDADGDVEVVTRTQILDGATGAVEATYSPANDSEFVVPVDLDEDGLLDVVTPTAAYDSSGTLIVDTELSGSNVAVADLDLDGTPEVVSIDSSNHLMDIWQLDAGPPGFQVVRQGVDLTAGISNPCCPVGSGCSGGGGSPMIGDVDGDGFPDVAVATGPALTVFEGEALMNPAVSEANTVLWQVPIQDCSSARSGASGFDFDDDGSVDIIHVDEVTLRILDGPTGDELFATCNTTGTLWEYPVVADVTGDGSANLVAPSNSYSSLSCTGTKTTGIRIFGDPGGGWPAARRVWNEHAYHVENVGDLGHIPTQEPRHYTEGGNHFRVAPEPRAALSRIVALGGLALLWARRRRTGPPRTG